MLTDRLRLLAEKVRASYWFVPTALLLLGGGLAYFMTWVDRIFEPLEFPWLAWLFSGGAQGAQGLLSAIASSVLGVAGTTFSITIAVLTLTSQQYGPRLLRTFLRDTRNQVVLGVFIGTFLYCLLVMGMVRGVDESLFVPQLSVAAGVILAVLSAFLLVYFIQHVVSSIQVSNVVALAGDDMVAAIQRMCPEVGEDDPDDNAEREPGLDIDGPHARVPAVQIPAPAVVRATSSGYVQAINTDYLVRKALEADARIDLVRRPGEFVANGVTLAQVVPPSALEPDLVEAINDGVTLGSYPTTAQDLALAPRQLSEIASRALSPGINDPGTANMCLDQLSNGLCELARRQMPPNLFRDDSGAVRLTERRPSFAVILDISLGQIRRYGAGDLEVLSRMLRLLTDVGDCARAPHQRDALIENAELVNVEGQDALPSAEARVRLAVEFERCMASLQRRRLPR